MDKMFGATRRSGADSLRPLKKMALNRHRSGTLLQGGAKTSLAPVELDDDVEFEKKGGFEPGADYFAMNQRLASRTPRAGTLGRFGGGRGPSSRVSNGSKRSEASQRTAARLNPFSRGPGRLPAAGLAQSTMARRAPAFTYDEDEVARAVQSDHSEDGPDFDDQALDIGSVDSN
jgi:hypothetical protein